MKIQVFDPPMCCSTGVCGPSIDPALIEFAADLEWAREQGVVVQRYNLAQQPEAFAGTKIVKEALANEGDACLPLIVVDGKMVCKGRYPSREMLAGFARIRSKPVDAHVGGAPRCCAPAPGDASTRSKKRGTRCC